MSIKNNLIMPTFNSIETEIFTEKILEDRKKSLLKLEAITKRGIDIIGATMGILLLMPLTAIIYIMERAIGDKGLFFTRKQELARMVNYLKCINIVPWW